MSGILEQRMKEKKDSPEYEKEIKKEKQQKPLSAKEKYKTSREEDVVDMEAIGETATEEDELCLKELEEIMSEQKFLTSEKKRKRRHKILVAGLTAGCIYMVTLIYGVYITNYEYNESGEIAPIVMTVDDIKSKKDYTELLGFYIMERTLYEKVLLLDYRMSAGQEDPVNLAPEYQQLLDDVSIIGSSIEASVMNSKYDQLKEMLLTWDGVHMNVYCQNMSKAISENNENAANEAIAGRSVVESYFQQITQNMISIGSEIKGVDVTEIENWSPQGFVSQTIEGVSPAEN